MGVCTSAPLSNRLKIIPVMPIYRVAAPRSWLSQTEPRAPGPASAAMVIATAPMMLDWIVKKLKKLTTLLPTVIVLASWVPIAASTANAISRRSVLPTVRPVTPRTPPRTSCTNRRSFPCLRSAPGSTAPVRCETEPCQLPELPESAGADEPAGGGDRGHRHRWRRGGPAAGGCRYSPTADCSIAQSHTVGAQL